jgi:hypothetical protein
MDDLITHRLGSVRLEPAGPVVAGSVGQWRLVYTVGSYGVDEGGTIKLSRRTASDWQVPQFDDPAAPGYTTVSTTGAAKLRPYYSSKAHVRPWKKCLVIDVYDGCLAPGDTVTIVLGDQSHGSPGIRAQTFQESAHEFRVLVDPTNAGLVRRLPSSPRVRIVPDRPVALVCILPTQALVGEPVEIRLRGVDRWGNPTLPPEDASFTWLGTGTVRLSGSHLTFTSPGDGYLRVEAGDLAVWSNPISSYDEQPALSQFWGDLHAQTEATVGTGTEEEYLAFARDQAYLDFASHQGNDFQMSDEVWERLNRTIERFHEDRRFVVLPGYEWSGNTPAGGDHNVIYRTGSMPILRSSHWQIPDTPENDLSPAHPASVLFGRLRQRVGVENVVVAAHVGGRYADVQRYFDPDLCRLVEILSCWGVFEWLLWDALEAGYVVGVICNSDGHKGRPGAEGPGAGEFGIAGGLTCVLAPELTRQAVFDALRARRCYGTSGPRIDLQVEMDGAPIGSILPWRKIALIHATVLGTGPLESLCLYQGREVIHQVRPAAFESVAGSRRIRVTWGGARMRGRGRRVTWDGAIHLDGVQIQKVRPVGFDSPLDGIVEQQPDRVAFRSRTTGDMDGLDLWLDTAGQGRLSFESPAGSCQVDLETLDGPATFDLGGLEMRICVERYPERLTGLTLSLHREIRPPRDSLTPYLVKVVQGDGHMAWSSPIYVQAQTAGGSSG